MSDTDTSAADHYTSGVASFVRDEWGAAITELGTALDLGLPEANEVEARAFLALSLLQLDGAEGERLGDLGRQAIEQIETAVSRDAAGGYSAFVDPDSRAAYLAQFDGAYMLEARRINQEQSRSRAIEYLEEHLKLYQHIPVPLFTLVNLELGALCAEENDMARARFYWKRAVEAEPWWTDEDGDAADIEADSKQKARNNLASFG